MFEGGKSQQRTKQSFLFGQNNVSSFLVGSKKYLQSAKKNKQWRRTLRSENSFRPKSFSSIEQDDETRDIFPNIQSNKERKKHQQERDMQKNVAREKTNGNKNFVLGFLLVEGAHCWGNAKANELGEIVDFSF